MTKSQAYYRSVNADRNEWRDEHHRCMNCNKPFGWFRIQEVHEILSRSQAPNDWGFRANYLALCQPCHGIVQNWTHAKQLALKQRMDCFHYDLDEWLRRRNPNAMQYVTQAEVDAA